MSDQYRLVGLGNSELVARLSALVRRGDELTAHVLAHLVELGGALAVPKRGRTERGTRERDLHRGHHHGGLGFGIMRVQCRAASVGQWVVRWTARFEFEPCLAFRHPSHSLAKELPFCPSASSHRLTSGAPS